MVRQHHYCSYQWRKTKFTWPSSNCSLTHSIADEALENLNNNMLRIKLLHNQIFKNSFNTLLVFIVHLSVLYRMLLEWILKRKQTSTQIFMLLSFFFALLASKLRKKRIFCSLHVYYIHKTHTRLIDFNVRWKNNIQ